MTDATPLVSLVGAGPGDPGLLTLRAVECLAEADLIVYDQLVPARLLDYAPAAAEHLCVTQLPHHPDRHLQIHRTLIDAARQGKRVVRLKGGDPFLFGRGGEEAEALRRAGIAYEVVPGVTAALAAAACAGIPLTHRSHASAVAFVTGHEQPDKDTSSLDWDALARFPGTLVLYMSITRLPQHVEALLRHGKAANTPAAVVRWASMARQRVVEAPLVELPAAVQAAGVKSPAIVLIGSVAALRSELAWFERRPLFGQRVLVTRPRGQAGDLVRQLERLGAACSLLPVIEVRDPEDWAPVDRTLAELRSYDWLVFTSVNGVHAFLKRLPQTGRDLRALGNVRLAAIGPSTAAALREYHLEVDLMPPEFRSESLAAALKERVVGQRVLLARADRGRDLLRQELETVATVEQMAVYSQVDTVTLDPAVLESLRRGEFDWVTLTSSNIARVFLSVLEPAARARIEAAELKLASISPVTSAAVRDMGLPVAVEAKEYTSAGIVQAIVDGVV
jgi:uroporphyrinogen III methyltransferase/synthase